MLPERVVVLLFGELELEGGVSFGDKLDNGSPCVIDALGGHGSVRVNSQLNTVLENIIKIKF